MYRDPKMLAFYRSKSWQKCRDAYAASVGNVCELCEGKGIIRTGEIVHHIIHLNPGNVGDPAISLSFDNLMLLCRGCHASVHEEIYGKDQKRFFISESGVVPIEDPPG